MNDRGLTLLELLVGIVTAAIIGAVSTQMLKAGIMTYNFSVSQNDALTKTRKALGREGASSGIMPAGRAAAKVLGLGVSSVTFASLYSGVTTYYVTAGNLNRTGTAGSALQAGSITSLAVGYYNMDANTGLIRVSSAASSATLVTALVTLKGKTNKLSDYTLYSGALLRNHP